MRKLGTLVSAAALAFAGPALAEGELSIFNWGNYTNPDLIKKFEAEYDIDVTLTDYDSNDTALAKVKAGGHGYDIVVPSATFIPIWINEGLLLETRPDQMSNFGNMAEGQVDVPYDPGRHYSVPWQWGTIGLTVDTSVYSGDPNTSSIFLDPPEELIGKIVVVPEMADIMALTIRYVGGEQCTSDKTVLRKVRDTLVAAKPKWLAIEYGNIEKFVKGDYAAGTNWNGSSMRVRLQNDNYVYGYPKEGYPIWSDNVVVLADAKNVENAKLFQNFIMDPQNAALISEFARYANGIAGSEAYMSDEMKAAPEVNIPEEHRAAGYVAITCPTAVTKIYTQIWTELNK
ncbi:MAG: spermidine/putrescine transport system substrate-binding protein [Paracoccaceae bacterium]|jgi:spermidine/putrescine transport system substrate-binding protein